MSIPNRSFADLGGMDVFTTDDEQIGVVERVLTPPDDPTQHYLLIRASGMVEMLGTDTLYVPGSDISAIEEDRVILDTPANAINRPDWTMPPFDLES